MKMYTEKEMKEANEAIKLECAEKAWPLLKQEYEWRSENSECGSDEISEGLDMLRFRLEAAILSAEPAQDDGKPEVGDIVCWPGQKPFMWDEDNELCGTSKPVILSKANSEVKRKIEEAKE